MVVNTSFFVLLRILLKGHRLPSPPVATAEGEEPLTVS